MEMDDFPTPTYLRNYRSVVDAYGYWPSFHDAPLLSFVEHDTSPLTIDLSVHAAEMTSDVDERGYFGSTKHHLIHFRFSGVKDVILEQFDIPNTLFEMTFSAPSDFERAGRFRVDLQSVMGGDCTLTFSADAGEVVSVDPRTGWPSRESDENS